MRLISRCLAPARSTTAGAPTRGFPRSGGSGCALIEPVMRCPGCRNRPLGVVAMVTLPNTHRERILCRGCGLMLYRQPMQSVGETAIVWMGVMLPIAPLAVVGGSLGFGLGVLALGMLLWVSPWQGLTYALPPGDDRAALPPARTVARG